MKKLIYFRLARKIAFSATAGFYVLFCHSVFFTVGQTWAQRPFVTLWDTNPIGLYGAPLLPSPQNRQIIFPGVGQNYTIEYSYIGQGIYFTGKVTGTNTTLITLPWPGKYYLRVTPGSGTFHRFNMAAFNPYGDYRNRYQLLAVTQWGDIRWSSMAGAFAGCQYMDVTTPDTPDLSAATDLSRMFEGCSGLVGTRSFNDWGTSNVRTMSHMFVGASVFNQGISNWNTANVVDMSGMFKAARAFNQYIGNWNVGNVYNMSDMFNYATSFNQSLYNWNTGRVVDMAGMFYAAGRFNQNIGNWNTANVINMESMFDRAASFNQYIANWNTANVYTMKWMFHKTTAFNQPIGNWNTGKVNNIEGMFTYASSFNQPLNNWNTSNITTMAGAFAYATSFNQPLSNWNTSKVRTMQWMFENARSFNQALGKWNITNVTNMGTMLSYSGLSTVKYDVTLLDWGAQAVKTGVVLGADGLRYCRGEDYGEGRIRLRSKYLWTIIGDRADCSNWCNDCRQNADSLAQTDIKVDHNGVNSDGEENFQVYPNPVIDNLHLEASNDVINTISIIDMTGRVVLMQEGPAPSQPVSVAKLPAGVYSLKVDLRDGRSKRQKILIAR